MKYPAQAKISQSFRFFDTRTHVLARIEAVERKSRLLSVACYFGLAPFLWFSGVNRQQNRLLRHHLLYSLAFSFSLLCMAGIYLIEDGVGYWFFVHIWNPSLAEFDAALARYRVYILVYLLTETTILLIGGLLWCGAWLASLVGAWRGRTPQIPVLSWVASKYQAIRIAVYWSLLIEVALLFLIGITIRSTQIARRQPAEAEVYVLYTVGGYITVPGLYERFTPPHWAVTLAFYPLIHAGIERFGPDGVAVLPLSEASFNEAIRTGKFIFVASHGGMSSGGFTISGVPYKEYQPSDVVSENVGEQLQYVYFSGCYTGDLESEWKRVLGITEATMFNRISFVDEHMLWAWFKSPGIIAALK